MSKIACMFSRLLMVVLSLCAALPAVAQSLSYRDVLQRPPLPKPDHRISYGSDALQFGELWLPQESARQNPHALFPVVLLIHGGCWLAELPGVELMAHMADALRKEGIAVWNLEYRRVGHAGGGYPGTFLDAANGADFLRVIADRYRLDLSRVVAVGHSAGGHLALWIAARGNLPQASLLKVDSPLKIKAVVGLAAIPDLKLYARTGGVACGNDTVDKLVNTAGRNLGDKTDAFRDTSIVELLPLNVPQTMIYGVYDSIVPPFIGMRFQMAAKAKGETLELMVIAAAAHFELIAPWTPAWKDVQAAVVAKLK